MTTLRYASLICTFGGIFTLWLAFRRSSPERLYLLIAAVSLIFTLTPLNIIDVPLKEQAWRLERLLTENDMLVDGIFTPKENIDDETRRAIVSAARYAEDGDALLAKRVLAEAAFTKAAAYDMEASIYPFFSFENAQKSLPVAGYSEAIPFDSDHVSDAGILEVVDGEGNPLRIDLASYRDALKEASSEPMAKHEDHAEHILIFTPDANTLVYFNRIHVGIPTHEGDSLKWHYATGIVLRKK